MAAENGNDRSARGAQVLFDAILRCSDTSWSARTVSTALVKARNVLVRHRDPLVQYELDGSDLVLPLSHDLPLYRRNFRQYGTNLARIGRGVHEKYPDLTCIDIGANVGDSVAVLRREEHFPILCIEGEIRFFSILERNTAVVADVELEQAFVAPPQSTLASAGAQRGTSRLAEADGSGCIATATLSEILARHERFAAAKLLKTDVDGLDLSILLAELDLLEQLAPVIFFELDPALAAPHGATPFDLFRGLAERGFATALFYENTGEYVCTASLTDARLLEDLVGLYDGRGGNRYADVCVFHGCDDDLAEQIRAAELAFFTGTPHAKTNGGVR